MARRLVSWWQAQGWEEEEEEVMGCACDVKAKAWATISSRRHRRDPSSGPLTSRRTAPLALSLHHTTHT